MKRNKYLDDIDDIGIKINNYGSNFIIDRKIQRFFERRKYGFDFRETINMDLMFAEWLYSRLMMLKQQTMDNLSFHSVKFEGQKYTVEQAVDQILKATKEYLYYYEVIEMSSEEVPQKIVEEIDDKMKKATRLWAVIMCYCDRVVVNRRKQRN